MTPDLASEQTLVASNKEKSCISRERASNELGQLTWLLSAQEQVVPETASVSCALVVIIFEEVLSVRLSEGSLVLIAACSVRSSVSCSCEYCGFCLIVCPAVSEWFVGTYYMR